MPGGFFIYQANEDEKLLYANKAVCDIFGCDDLDDFKAFTGFTFRGMVHPDDYERVSSSITHQVEASQSDLDFVEYRIIRKDGKVRWLDDYGHYIEYDDQNSLYYEFSDALVFYSTFVAEGDRRQFLEAVTPGNIIRNTENKMTYSVPFRRVFDNGIRYYRLEFSKLHLDNENINFVVGFKDVDDEVRKDLRHR
jgi:PAS domain S-box-containing protein